MAALLPLVALRSQSGPGAASSGLLAVTERLGARQAKGGVCTRRLVVLRRGAGVRDAKRMEERACTTSVTASPLAAVHGGSRVEHA
jgi:hypothetical protein